MRPYNGHRMMGGCLSQVCEKVNSEIKRYPVYTVRHMRLKHAAIFMTVLFVLLNDRNSNDSN
jgi:hypothetical protein